ncbi:MAG TPA: YbjN domain-containing protein [Candidatus Limnocylindrales bacterium]
MSAPGPALVEAWLRDLGIEPVERAEREGVSSWDFVLDGRRRFDVRVTLILDPTLGAIAWVQYAPPISDAFRKSYRRLLRWNDDFPFVKFSISDDERPILMAELPIDRLDRDELGLCLARLLAVCDQLIAESADWLARDGRRREVVGRRSRGAALLERYAARLGELAGAPLAESRPVSTAPALPGPTAAEEGSPVGAPDPLLDRGAHSA